MRRARRALAAGLLLTLAACGGSGVGASEPGTSSDSQVLAAFYPLQFLAERIGGPDVAVSGLTPPGAEPHDLELSPRQVGAVSSADLVLYLGGFQPAVDAAVAAQAGDRSLDVATVTPLEREPAGPDPHLWLDPTRMRALTSAVADRLAAATPAADAGIRARAAALDAELAALDADFRAGLTGCARTELVTSHEAFGYLARQYGLTQVGIAGLSPEQEPSPRRLAELAELARASGVTTVFFEPSAGPQLAEALAREVGARVEALNPLEGPPSQGDYLTAMRANLSALRAALGCA